MLPSTPLFLLKLCVQTTMVATETAVDLITAAVETGTVLAAVAEWAKVLLLFSPYTNTHTHMHPRCYN